LKNVQTVMSHRLWIK